MIILDKVYKGGRHLYFNGRLWEAMGGTGGSPQNFLYFNFIYEYFGGWPPVIYIYIVSWPLLVLVLSEEFVIEMFSGIEERPVHCH